MHKCTQNPTIITSSSNYVYINLNEFYYCEFDEWRIVLIQLLQIHPINHVMWWHQIFHNHGNHTHVMTSTYLYDVISYRAYLTYWPYLISTTPQITQIDPSPPWPYMVKKHLNQSEYSKKGWHPPPHIYILSYYYIPLQRKEVVWHLGAKVKDPDVLDPACS